MKKQKKSNPVAKQKLTLDRETLLALQPTDLEEVAAGATSRCHSGVTCCVTACA